MERCKKRRNSIQPLKHIVQISTNGLFRIASTYWNIVTLINITFEEDIRKPILFILWALRQLPGLARSAANRVLKDIEGAGNELESLSWEILWVAVNRIEEGIVQVIIFWDLESPKILLLSTLLLSVCS